MKIAKIRKIRYFCNEFSEMHRFFIGILIFFFGITACNRKDRSVKGDVLLFPESTQVIYRINDKNLFLSSIENNIFWKENNPKPLRSYETKLIQSLPAENNIWVSFTAYKNFFAISKKEENDTLSIWKNANHTIQKQSQFGKEWFYTVINNRLIVSSSYDINTFFSSDESIKTPSQVVLEELQKIAPTSCSANLFMQKEQANLFFSSFFKTDITRDFNHWVALDLFLEENDVRFNGMAKIQPNSEGDILAQTQPYANKLASVLPSHILGLVSYTFKNADRIALKDSTNVPFKKSINGVAFAQTIDGQFAVVSSFDTDETLLQLPILSEDAQSDFPLYELNDDASLDFFKIFESGFRPKYVSVHDPFLILSRNKEVLHSVMGDIARKNTLSVSKTYELLEKNTVSKAGMTRIANLHSNSDFKRKYPKIADTYRWVAFQQTPQDDFYILNFVGKKQPPVAVTEKMRERFSFHLDAEILTSPFIVLNHRTKRLEVAIQDTDFNLYLIGNNGTLLWKKKLDGKIQSPIYQVDLFKNGFLQMAFSTEKSVWIIDRNGNDVAPFPKKYKKSITPLEVFDYEKNREYRFLFAEGKNLNMLDKKGELVGGFLRKTTDASPLFTPKHYRANNKDFLVYISDNGKFNVLHRNGETRIPIQGKFDFSDNSPFFFDNKFLFSTKAGELVRIDLNGNIIKTDRQWTKNHYLTGNQHTTSFLSENTLSIGNVRLSIPDGIYERQKLFRIRGMNYISVTDTKNQRVYLWNEQGKSVQNFPISGVSSLSIDVDLDKSVWLVVAKSANVLSVYETNDLK